MTDNQDMPSISQNMKVLLPIKLMRQKQKRLQLRASAVNPGPAWQGRIASRSGGRDILAILATGAYNYSMSSNYNRIPRPAVVLVKDGKARVIVKREDYNDIIRNDIIPEDL